jgi:hypothetical protein
VTRVIITRRKKLAVPVACMGENKNGCRVLVRKAERENLEDLGVDVRIILKYILQK